MATITSETRVMERTSPTGTAYDMGTVYDYFGSARLRFELGESQGEDAARGAYDWWPIMLDGKTIGELRDDASGLTVHVIAAA